MVWNPPQMQIQQLILGPKKWDPAVLSGSSSTTHGKCPHGVRRLRGMIFQQRIWQRPFFFTSSGSFHQVDGTLGNPLRRPWRCFESSWHVMVWPDVWAEKKTSEDWHFDAWRSKWVNQQFSLDSSARSIYTGSSRNMLGGQLVPFHLRAVFVLKRDKEENMMYIYIYIITYTDIWYSYLNQDVPVYPWTSRNFVTGDIYVYIHHRIPCQKKTKCQLVPNELQLRPDSALQVESPDDVAVW